jgi:hypothetical protein
VVPRDEQENVTQRFSQDCRHTMAKHGTHQI